MAEAKHGLLRRAYEKFFLNTVAGILRRDPAAMFYMLSFAVKKEVSDFYTDFYIRQYRHIEAAIQLAQRMKLNQSANELILDIGGGNGETAMMFSAAFPQTQIMILEPVKKNQESITPLLGAHPNLVLIPKAAGSQASTQKIFIGRNKHTSSFYEMESDRESKLFSHAIEITESEEVEVIRLDELVSPAQSISIMKMDIQGSELEALKGAAGILKRTSVIVLEVNNHDHYKGAPKYNEIDSYLCDQGFELFDILPSTYDNGKLKEWDVIYRKMEVQ